MKRLASNISCYMLCATLLMGCQGDAEPAAPQSASVASASQEMLAAADLVLPMESVRYRSAELDNFETIGAQVWIADAVSDQAVISEAYMIGRALYFYRDYNNTLIFNTPFSSPDEIPNGVKIDIAVSQAPHVDIYSAAFQKAQGHPLHTFVEDRRQSGKSIGLIAYASDVQDQAARLFGKDCNLQLANGKSVFYDSELDIFYLETPAANTYTDYPIVLSFESRGMQIDANVTIVCYSDVTGRWASKDGSWVSASSSIDELRKYLGTNMAEMPKYHYVLERSSDDKSIPATVVSFSAVT